MASEKLEENPVLKSNVISKLFFWWLNGFFWKGSKRELELSDMYQVIPKDASKSLGDLLTENWNHELKIEKEKNSNYNNKEAEVKPGAKKRQEYVPSLAKALTKLFWLDFSLVGLLALFEECFTRIAQPICLGYLIRYFSKTGELNEAEGYLFASGIIFTAILYTFTHHPFFFGVCHIGMQIRVACCSIVYRKSLKLSQLSLAETTIGQLVNLLSNDVNRFDQITVFLVYLVIGPIQTVIITCLLWNYLGPSCLVGLLVLVLFVPFQGYMGRLFSSLRVQTAGKTDKRIRIMNEIVTGMQVIKYYTWEKPFSEMVDEARKDEVKVIRKTSLLRAINMSLFYTSSKIIIFLTLLTYVLLNERLSAEKVFVTLSLYNNVRLVMTLFFPSAIAQLNEAMVSIKRLQDFLLMQEKDEPVPDLSNKDKNFNQNSSLSKESIEKVGIVVEGFSAKWNSSYEENTLNDVNFTVGSGELVTIIGSVGSGKSSLLYAIMNELPGIKGRVKVFGTISYASQEPWVYSGSVRDNILFGKDYDPVWYDQVVEACALKRDLILLPHGDHSLVGDRGSSLSGGQKARINLARAVYSNADIYLLDDPLSAVDASVSRHLYDKCINGILKDKIRILVTHQLQYLKNQNHIIVINNGKIEISGTFDELLRSDINFTHLLQTTENTTDGISSTGSFSRTQSVRGSSGKLVNLSNHLTPIRTRTGSQSSITLTHQPEIGLGENSLLGNIYSHDALVASVEDMIQEQELQSHQSSKSIVKTNSHGSKKDDIEFIEFIPKQAEEQRASGTVKLSHYGKYFKAGGGCCVLFILVATNIITQVLYTGSDYYLNFWTNAEEKGNDKPNSASPDCKDKNDVLYKLKCDSNTQIITYSTIVGALFIFSMIRTILFFNVSMNSSVNLHQSMFQGIIRAPMKFFEENPVGRILNRFSKDIGQIDDALPPCHFDAVGILLNVIGILVIIACVNPILIAPAAVLSVVFYYLRRFYLKTARSVKRLEGVARSPVFSHLSTTLYGLSTIRAFKTQAEFIKQFDDHQDLHTSSWYLFLATTRWFGVWLDWISTLFIASVTYSFMFSRDDGAAVGLAVASAMTLSGMFQWGIRQSAEVENQMVSVERVLDYTKIEPEAALESAPALRPPSSWPSKGEIKLNNLRLQYGDHVVLNGITCEFRSSEKVGIVGRTGAGKSSMITALFRLAEPTGEIIIDGINIQTIGLHDLRSKISIIPQDPVLFTGTLRKNLDPFNDYTDADIWSVLEQVHLAEEIRQVPDGIYVEISEGGSNFSVGQRQLVCLGRAILRKNKILVLDEATANVDPETDALIQTTIRTKFVECTVLTIAHRLHTVMDSDRILVLDAGRIKEFDVPYNLLQDKNGALQALVKETGHATAENLRQISKLNANNKERRLSSNSDNNGTNN